MNLGHLRKLIEGLPDNTPIVAVTASKDSDYSEVHSATVINVSVDKYGYIDRAKTSHLMLKLFCCRIYNELHRNLQP